MPEFIEVPRPRTPDALLVEPVKNNQITLGSLYEFVTDAQARGALDDAVVNFAIDTKYESDDFWHEVRYVETACVEQMSISFAADDLDYLAPEPKYSTLCEKNNIVAQVAKNRPSFFTSDVRYFVTLIAAFIALVIIFG